MTTLPTLYKKTSTGAIQQWTIHVEGSTIVKTYGQTGGQMQEARDVIAEGKNIGRSNETTPEQQAQLEAQAQWEKKAKKGYVRSHIAAAISAVDEEFITGGINPMLAHSHAKHGHKITYPAFVQPKLDGHRCVAIIEGGVATLWSRTRKPITGLPHIVDALSGLPDAVLDGELYNHEYRDNFEALTSFIKRAEPKPGHEVVEYHVYDIVTDVPFAVRVGQLSVTVRSEPPVVLVDTHRVEDPEDVAEMFALMRGQGYEGLMLRNTMGPYVGKRSYDLQKVKEFDDREFVIVGVEEGRGRMAGRGIFVCATDAGDEFRVKMRGSLDSLDGYLEFREDFIGKHLTVQFQGITNDNKVPRFPIGLRIREDV